MCCQTKKKIKEKSKISKAYIHKPVKMFIYKRIIWAQLFFQLRRRICTLKTEQIKICVFLFNKQTIVLYPRHCNERAKKQF